MGIKSISLAATALVLSTSVNASILNTLNGTNYEWLELTETAGMSRTSIESQISNPNSSLYGYEYASKALTQSLLFSYASWDGINGNHGNPETLNGAINFINDFGSLYSTDYGSTLTRRTVDAGFINVNNNFGAVFFYGTSTECSDTNKSCLGRINFEAMNATPLLFLQSDSTGWGDIETLTIDASMNTNQGSLLVKVSAVPIPATIWLFCSGLIGLVGFARHKKA